MTPYLILLCFILISVLYWMVWKIHKWLKFELDVISDVFNEVEDFFVGEMSQLRYRIDNEDVKYDSLLSLFETRQKMLEKHLSDLQSQIKQLKVKKEK